jgi:release factor glutamine methyltransferase
VAAVLTAHAARLATAGIDSPRHDAEELAAHVLGVRRGQLAAVGTIDPDAAARLAELMRRRADREPVQHLTGRAGFRRIDVAVGPGVFVPRPETESVVEWCLDALRGEPTPLVVDLCAGSGVVALALAQELADAEVRAVESDADAYRWLSRNAADRTAAGDPAIIAHHADAARALAELDGTVDLVVSNPPYVADGKPVDPEVRDHDPAVALRAGADGLAAIRLVERAARRLLRRGGQLAVEHSDDQGTAVPELLAAAGWDDVEDHADLAGRPRFTTARWHGQSGGAGGSRPAW